MFRTERRNAVSKAHDSQRDALEAFIQRSLDTAPRLTDEQRHRLAALLRGGGTR